MSRLYALPYVLLLLLATGGVAKPVGDMAMLDSLDRGMWQLRPMGGSVPMTRICLGELENLTQIQHNGLACDQYIVRSSASLKASATTRHFRFQRKAVKSARARS